MSAISVSFTRNIVVEECWVCGTPFGMAVTLRDKFDENGTTFFCPRGDRLRYGEGEVARLQREVQKAQQAAIDAREEAKNAVITAKREVTRRQNIQKRIRAGVCPECHRHFENVERHMNTKHPKE